MDSGVVVALPQSQDGSGRGKNAGEEANRQMGRPHILRDVLPQHSSPEVQVVIVEHSIQGSNDRATVLISSNSWSKGQGLLTHTEDSFPNEETEDSQPWIHTVCPFWGYSQRFSRNSRAA